MLLADIKLVYVSRFELTRLTLIALLQVELGIELTEDTHSALDNLWNVCCKYMGVNQVSYDGTTLYTSYYR